MTRLDRLLAYAETHRIVVSAIASSMVAGIAFLDYQFFNVTIGYLYVFPILLSAAALNTLLIVAFAIACAVLQQLFDPAGLSISRLVVVMLGFVMTGFFAAELNQRRRLLADYLQERREADIRLRVLIETSPLAILTLDDSGRIVLANESARELLGFEREPGGELVQPYLPILERLLHSNRSGGNIRTNVECNGRRVNGDVFLAHVWLSTYRTSSGSALAAVIWDASENLRDREDAGLNSMMATSRVLIGALSHEIRNLAAAASAAYASLKPPTETSDAHQALGTLVHGLERIANSGLHVSSDRQAAAADLGTVLDETRIVIEPMLKDAGIQVAWEAASGLPLVQADHHGLLQVFVNLARNSVRALEDWRGERQVRINASVEHDLVCVRFRDSGPGVAHPEELFKAFQPGAQSFGLGLYISRAILRAHGGELRYEPAPQGACFTVELWPVENRVEV
jgi:PAS domain S-box-containing protein